MHYFKKVEEKMTSDATRLCLCGGSSSSEAFPDLVHMFFGQGVEHAEAVVEGGCEVSKNLPCEAERDPKNVMHVVSCCPMRQISWTTP